MTENLLFYGDNLDVLRQHIKDETIDLIYLDPPFNSNANYNVLFKEKSGKQSEAQIQAFGDTWHWDQAAASAYEEIVESGGKISEALQAFKMLVGQSDMLAYLTMMTSRLVELHRVLKQTGSLYLHCDPTAAHYLKIILDTIFGPLNFRNNITWKRSDTHNDAKKQFSAISDTILFYAKSDKAEFHVHKIAHTDSHIKNWFINLQFADGSTRRMTKDEIEKDQIPEGARRFSISDLSSPHPRPNLMYSYKGFPYPANGWRCKLERMEQLDKEGRLLFPSKPDGRIVMKKFLDEQEGIVVGDIWSDIPQLRAQDAERLGYPTQKPVALLERIINASSNPGDLILDPFCGCGTAIAAAQKLNCQWIGIDITHLAINLIKHRLFDSYGDQVKYRTIGEPTSLSDAKELAETNPYQFQWWALGLVGARSTEEKKGADHGVDGKLFFHDEPNGKTKQVVFSVKAGGVGVSQVRDLCHVVDREKADIGVFLCLEEPTKPMRAEAAGAGFYTSPWGKHPRIQILSIADLFSGKKIDMPPIHQVNSTFKKAPKNVEKKGNQLSLIENDESN
jgi:site-specific DNA-methyltransferase (adenine-specific)